MINPLEFLCIFMMWISYTHSAEYPYQPELLLAPGQASSISRPQVE